MARVRPLTAAGAVVWRRRVTGTDGDARHLELLLVHRPRYDDWTFPKGKPDPGEVPATTAVREVAEETGQVVRLGHPLPPTRYRVAAGPKQVSYWIARVVGPTTPPFAPNEEVDELRWVRPRDAGALLTYEHDRALLASFAALRAERAHRTRTLVVVRHRAGTAPALVPVLAAYGVRRLVSSPAEECIATLAPGADATGALLEIDERLGRDARRTHVERAAAALTATKIPTAVCATRRPVTLLLAALGVDGHDLAPGEGLVLHHRRNRVLAAEPLHR